MCQHISIYVKIGKRALHIKTNMHFSHGSDWVVNLQIYLVATGTCMGFPSQLTAQPCGESSMMTSPSQTGTRHSTNAKIIDPKQL